MDVSFSFYLLFINPPTEGNIVMTTFNLAGTALQDQVERRLRIVRTLSVGETDTGNFSGYSNP